MASFGVSDRFSLSFHPLSSFPVFQMKDVSSWDLPPAPINSLLTSSLGFCLAVKGSPAVMLDVQSYSFPLFSFPLLAKEALLEVLSPASGLSKFPKRCK